MKVYTKTGDKGTTSLIGGRRVSKNHIRIDAYGTIDELMAHTGYLHDTIENKEHKLFLLQVQDRLMTCATILAADAASNEFILPEISEDDIQKVETEIDQHEKKLPLLTKFILPGGHPSVSYCHIARTVCRRAERLVIKVIEEENHGTMVMKYLNRLSDYFFILSRKLADELNCEEITWNPQR